VRLGPYRATGYLRSAATPAALADRIGVPAAALEATIGRFNAAAREGRDPDFGRGESAYDRGNGDPAHRPNPALGPLSLAPFHAIRIRPGDIGTFVGLSVDPAARVLDGAGAVVPGLWAAGNAATPLTAGTYPAAGLTIGAAVVFGWIAGCGAAKGAEAGAEAGA
jgi:succinate dehydrogenase/fumarate reductase flavoprotein subunit